MNPVEQLQRKLQRAVTNEEYEEAARPRDELIALEKRDGEGTSKPVG